MAELLWKPLDPNHIRDPYPMYRTLRQEQPVHRAQTGEYIVTRYADVRSILKSPDFNSGNRLEWLKRGIRYFQNKEEDFHAIYQAMNSFVLMLNGSQHARIRNFVTRTWNNRQVDDIILKNIAHLLNSLEDNTEADLVDRYAQRLPVLTICHILGIPTTDYYYIKDLGIAMTKTLDLYVSYRDMVQMNDASRRFITFFEEQLRAKQSHPDEGLLSKLIQKNRQENIGLSEEELISIAIFLFIAGEETSASLISTGLYLLLKHPAAIRYTLATPEVMESTLEEILRFDSVVQLLGRLANQDYPLGSTIIPKGSTVTLVVGAANRDPDFFANADHFEITRKPNRHLAFGNGIHFCLGDWLARRQGQLGIRALLQKFPATKLITEQPSYLNHLAIRSIRHLQVVLRA